MELADGDHNSATSQLRQVLRGAVLRRLVTQQIFPVVSSFTQDIHPVAEWRQGPSVVLCAPLSLLSNEVQEQLIAAGLPLVHLTAALEVDFTQAAAFSQAAPHFTLSPCCLCDFLRGVEVRSGEGLGSRETVLKLISFIAPQSSNDTCDLSLLRGLPLLLTKDGTLQTFGHSECFWDNSELLPILPGRFVDEDLRASLLSTSKSRLAVTRAAAVISIRSLMPRAMLPFHDIVHSHGLPKNDKWLSHFYSLLWQYAKQNSASDLSISDFREWQIVKVFAPNGRIAMVSPDELRTVFALHETDHEWQSEIGSIVLACGWHTLHSDHLKDPNQKELLESFVGKGDDSLLQVLKRASPNRSMYS